MLVVLETCWQPTPPPTPPAPLRCLQTNGWTEGRECGRPMSLSCTAKWLAPLTHWPLISPWVLSRLGSLRLASGVDIAVLSREKGSRVKTKSADGCHPGGLCQHCKNMSLFGLSSVSGGTPHSLPDSWSGPCFLQRTSRQVSELARNQERHGDEVIGGAIATRLGLGGLQQ